MARNANIMSFDSVVRDGRTRRTSTSSSNMTAASVSRTGRRIPLSSEASEPRYRFSDEKAQKTRTASARDRRSAQRTRAVSSSSDIDSARTSGPLERSGAVLSRSAGTVSPGRSGAVFAQRGGSSGARKGAQNPAAAAAGSAIQSYDEFLEEEDRAIEEATGTPRTASDKRKAKRENRKRAAKKQQAERKFAKTYGASDASASDGPRAALYKGRMGRKQKRANRLQQTIAESSSVLQSFEIKRPKSLSTRMIVMGAVAACLVFACLFLYEPARVYYQEMREVARLELEYAAVVERNDAIEFDVELLQTQRGIVDQAREMLGWVAPDEHAGSVVGTDFTTNSNFSAHVVKEAIKPPETWYSPILDPIFGVS